MMTLFTACCKSNDGFLGLDGVYWFYQLMMSFMNNSFIPLFTCGAKHYPHNRGNQEKNSFELISSCINFWSLFKNSSVLLICDVKILNEFACDDVIGIP